MTCYRQMIDGCPVCYEDIANESKLACGHHIHASCIIASGKAECPVCRSLLPDYKDRVIEIEIETPQWGTLDKLVSLGWLKHADIPIIDDLQLPRGNDLLLVKAVVLLYAIKQAVFAIWCM